jgi:hypothetical protein
MMILTSKLNYSKTNETNARTYKVQKSSLKKMDISAMLKMDSLPVSFAMEIHIQKVCLLHLLLELSCTAG